VYYRQTVVTRGNYSPSDSSGDLFEKESAEMAMTLGETAKIAGETGLPFERQGLSRLVFTIPTDRYRNLSGERSLRVVLQLNEDGEYVTIYAPNAFNISAKSSEVFIRACMQIQWKTRLVQFEYDSVDGEIRPVVEFPLEDSGLTTRQISRCLRGVAAILDEYYLTLHKASVEGVLQFPRDNVEEDIDRIRTRLKEIDITD
jgi:hypothetical protein